MKLLVDMNLSPHWVPLLVKAGMQARHWSEVGKPDASDLEIFDYAALNDYVILTYDLDFGAILAVGRGKQTECGADPEWRRQSRSGCHTGYTCAASYEG